MAVEGKREGVTCRLSSDWVVGVCGCVQVLLRHQVQGLWASPGRHPDVLEYKSGDWQRGSVTGRC